MHFFDSAIAHCSGVDRFLRSRVPSSPFPPPCTYLLLTPKCHQRHREAASDDARGEGRPVRGTRVSAPHGHAVGWSGNASSVLVSAAGTRRVWGLGSLLRPRLGGWIGWLGCAVVVVLAGECYESGRSVGGCGLLIKYPSTLSIKVMAEGGICI